MVQLQALILAGGQSSRMGEDKALLPIQGQPLLQRICQVALQCTSEVAVITPWPNRYHAILPPTCEVILETPLVATFSPQGPLVALAQGLVHLQRCQSPADWVLLLACDLPNLSAAALQAWAATLATTSPPAIACLPRQYQRWEPLCGFYRPHCLPNLQAFITQGGRSFQRWLAQQPVEALPWGDDQSPLSEHRRLLFNCNTPEDWQLIQSVDLT
ncbi:molybdenum cofactor guanylyltransferase [Neosynechococcus sphagnicola]|uniref:molybdenum cofactor guanylyltransferase n=1 Tax=Neosynechococcus sphagnicola TaxID=1501145 RepID=UPI00056CEA7C|nr:molybdenum cofactor guanylyltransferase [Neosynechococcus sphagnicola]